MLYKKNKAINLYVDALIIQAAFGDEVITKKAEGEFVASLISSVKDYVNAHIDPNDKVGSVVNLLAPGAFSTLVSSLFPSLKWLSFIFGLAMRIFNIDIASVLKNISSDIKSLIYGGKEISSDHVDNIVTSHFSAVPPATQEDAERFLKSSHIRIREAKLIKLALININDQLIKNSKSADTISSFILGKRNTVNLLAKAIGWIIKIILASAGLMMAGDAVNALLGKSSAFTGTLQHGKPIDTTKSKQTRFKVNTSYSDIAKNTKSSVWVENISPSRNNIINLVLDFMEEVYPETKDFNNEAMSTPGFQVIVDEILDYNEANQNRQITYIPKAFDTKKRLVDMFIDQVAEKAGNMQKS
jgi:gas vesicle protein